MTELATYVPRPNSVPSRAIAHVKEHGATATRPLSEAVGLDHSAVHNTLAAAVKHGALVRERRKDGLTYYSEGDGTPLPPDEDAPRQKTVPAATSGGIHMDKLQCAGPVAQESWRDGIHIDPFNPPAAPLTPAVRVSDKPTPASSHFRCGLWNDGETTIEKGAMRMTLSKAQTRELAMLLGVSAGIAA